MNAFDRFDQFDHPAWLTATGTLASYGLILLFLFALLFILPYLALVLVF